MRGNRLIVGVFAYLDDTLSAVENIKQRGLDFRVFAPAAMHEIEDASMPGKSNVRRVTLTGALLGICFGFSLAILCNLDWPIRVSAKDPVAIPAFVVIGYECTILFGGIFTLLGLLHFCRLPNLFRKVGYDPRFSDDKFGVAVGCEADAIEEIKAQLTKAGAEEVQVRDGL